jgi:hypothetical protein
MSIHLVPFAVAMTFLAVRSVVNSRVADISDAKTVGRTIPA